MRITGQNLNDYPYLIHSRLERLNYNERVHTETWEGRIMLHIFQTPNSYVPPPPSACSSNICIHTRRCSRVQRKVFVTVAVVS